MKRIFPLPFLIILTASLCNAQTEKPKPAHDYALIAHKRIRYTLTAHDRKNYVLSVDQRELGKPKEVVKDSRKVYKLFVPVKLENKTNDTLRYLNMSCSWYEIYQTNNKNIQCDSWPCDKNFLKDIILLPHHSSMIKIPFIVNKTARNNKFKIGMFLVKDVDPNTSNPYFNDFVMGRNKGKGNLIWSNEVEILADKLK